MTSPCWRQLQARARPQPGPRSPRRCRGAGRASWLGPGSERWSCHRAACRGRGRGVRLPPLPAELGAALAERGAPLPAGPRRRVLAASPAPGGAQRRLCCFCDRPLFHHQRKRKFWCHLVRSGINWRRGSTRPPPRRTPRARQRCSEQAPACPVLPGAPPLLRLCRGHSINAAVYKAFVLRSDVTRNLSADRESGKAPCREADGSAAVGRSPSMRSCSSGAGVPRRLFKQRRRAAPTERGPECRQARGCISPAGTAPSCPVPAATSRAAPRWARASPPQGLSAPKRRPQPAARSHGEPRHVESLPGCTVFAAFAFESRIGAEERRPFPPRSCCLSRARRPGSAAPRPPLASPAAPLSRVSPGAAETLRHRVQRVDVHAESLWAPGMGTNTPPAAPRPPQGSLPAPTTTGAPADAQLIPEASPPPLARRLPKSCCCPRQLLTHAGSRCR